MQQRIGAVIRAYESQDHRTGTVVDRQSAEWLAGEVRGIGAEPVLEEFTLSAASMSSAASITTDGRTIEGLPLFDGTFTEASGIAENSATSAAMRRSDFAELLPNAADAGALGGGAAPQSPSGDRRVTRGGRDGLSPEQC